MGMDAGDGRIWKDNQISPYSKEGLSLSFTSIPKHTTPYRVSTVGRYAWVWMYILPSPSPLSYPIRTTPHTAHIPSTVGNTPIGGVWDMGIYG